MEEVKLLSLVFDRKNAVSSTAMEGKVEDGAYAGRLVYWC